MNIIYLLIVFLNLLFCQNDSAYYSCIKNNKVVKSTSKPIEVISHSVCLNATQPIKIFTDTITNLPFNFVYKINGGVALTMYLSKVDVPIDFAVVFIYILLSFTDAEVGVTSFVESVTVHTKFYPDT